MTQQPEPAGGRSGQRSEGRRQTAGVVKEKDWAVRPDTPPSLDTSAADAAPDKEPSRSQGPQGSRETASSGGAEPFFRVRLINIDHTMQDAGPLDRTETAFGSNPLRRVPVIRIFGATPAGQRVCMHVHGAFPYCYIEYKDKLDPETVLSNITKVGTQLNALIGMSLGRNMSKDDFQYINAIYLVKGTPFYGYHVGWRYFLKIHFTDPSLNARIHTILDSTKQVLNSRFQPFEIHIRYQLQWMLDYNLYGCGYVDLEECHFRCELPAADPISSQASSQADSQRKIWTQGNIPEHLIQGPHAAKISHCDLEIDVQVSAILNRRRLRSREMHHVFEEKDLLGGEKKLVPSLIGLWEEEQTRRIKAGLSATIAPPKSIEGGRLLKEGEHPRWAASDRDYEQLQAILKKDLAAAKQSAPPGKETDKERFTKESPFTKHIVSAFDSVELLHIKRNHVKDAAEDPGNPFSQSSRMTQSKAREPQKPSSPTALVGKEHTRDLSFSQRSRGSTESGPLDPLSSGPELFGLSQDDFHFVQSQGFQAQVQKIEQAALDREAADESDDEPAQPDDVDDPGSRPGTPRRAKTTPLASPVKNHVSSSAPTSPVKTRSSLKVGPTSETPRKRTITADSAEDSILQSSAHPYKAAKVGKASDPFTPLTSVRKTGRVMFADMLTGSSPPVRFGQSSSSHMPATPARNRRIAEPIIGHQYGFIAPTKEEVMDSFALFDQPREDHTAPFFSAPSDVPKPREYAGRTFTFKSTTLPYLEEFETNVRLDDDAEEPHEEVKGLPVKIKSWEYAAPLPARSDVEYWLLDEQSHAAETRKKRRRRLASQIEKMTQQQVDSTYGFKVSQHTKTNLVQREKQHMSVLAIEVLAASRGGLLPDPEFDAIHAIFYSFQNEDEALEDNGSRPGLRTGFIVVRRDEVDMSRMGLSCDVFQVDSEEDALASLVVLVRRFNPEILVGYEIHNGSWGYVVERAKIEYDLELVAELGRVKEGNTGAAKGKSDQWGYTQTSALRITGRHVLNIWRLMRGEVALTQYSFENVVFHLLHRRVPLFSASTLNAWWGCTKTPELVSRVARFFVERVETDLEIIESSEMVFRTAEFARIYGVDFFSVINRGSQFKVESVMFRIAKPENFLLPSPSTLQVSSQNAAEHIPLIMEPQSAFFKGPLVVLDFQSLYPSVMIAYNICYSTCLGRVREFKGTQKFGFSDLNLPPGLLNVLKDDVAISPNGLIFVKPHIRRSLLAKMLGEILDTRVMIKGSMKGVKDDKSFLRVQNARQLSIKLLANVTYGYTSATFSGRMPCVEIADAIVSYGRETLERAIHLIQSEPKWGAKVVYGDTDSLFIYLEGRTREDAFKIGNDIADTVTANNPKPVKLKFEKVYLPSVLLAKKRYVGYKYEHPDEDVPTFDAKGIETVRRDGNPALQRIQEACLRILFRTRDLSQVKAFLQRQWRKIMEGRVNIQDFVIAKEVRMGGYSDKTAPPPGAAVAAQKMLRDRRAEPQHAERVPYIITAGAPGAKMNDRAQPPEEMLKNPSLRLDAKYYIERSLIPPLERIFNLLGADVASWFKQMSRVQTIFQGRLELNGRKTLRLTLDDHYRSEHCLICGDSTDKLLCLDCRLKPQETVLRAMSQHHLAQARHHAMTRICASCSALPHVEDSPCVSLDCPMLFAKSKAALEVENLGTIAEHLDLTFESIQQAEMDKAWSPLEM